MMGLKSENMSNRLSAEQLELALNEFLARVDGDNVEILAIVQKSKAVEWLEKHGEKNEESASD